MDDMRDLMAPYVMDALDVDERRRFEAYLAEHPELVDELETMRTGLTALAEEGAATPPPTLRASVLDAIADVPQESPLPSENRTPSRVRRWIAAAAFATAAVVVGIVGVSIGGGLTAADVLAADDVRTVTAPVGAADAQLAFSAELAAAVVTFGSLPDVSDDETFQLWVIDEDGPTSAGVFRPSAGETQVLLEQPVAPGVIVGLTVEPAGGSLQPTGDILATWSVST